MAKNYDNKDGHWITTKEGKHLFIREDLEDKKEREIGEQRELTKKLTEEHNKPKSLKERLSGDALLDAEDLIEELKANEAVIDENGYVTLYHRTNENSANEIMQTGKMRAKEDGIFFSTKKDGQAEGYGKAVVVFHIPVEKLVLDDEFGDEAHVRIPLKNRNVILDVSDYLRR